MVHVMTQARGRRARRGSAAAGFATFVALTSHVIAGGSLPTPMGVIVPLALSTLVCVLLAGRRLSLPRLSLSVVASQSLFHLLFSVFTPMTRTADPANAMERHAMHHAGAAPMSASMSGSISGAPGAMSGSGTEAMTAHAHASPAMLAAHLLAAVLTIAMIYWSEVLPERIGTFLRLVIHALLPSLARPIPVPSRAERRFLVVDILPRRLGVLRSPVLTRGPPARTF